LNEYNDIILLKKNTNAHFSDLHNSFLRNFDGGGCLGYPYNVPPEHSATTFMHKYFMVIILKIFIAIMDCMMSITKNIICYKIHIRPSQ